LWDTLHHVSFPPRNVRPEIYELFQITRLDRLFEIEHA